MRFSTEVQGDTNIFLRLQGVRGIKEQVSDLMRNAAYEAEGQMLAMMPRSNSEGHGDGDHQHLSDAVRVQILPFTPGGAGGGGFYEAKAGFGLDPPSHLKYVLGGTGVHGARGNVIRPRYAFALQFPKLGGGEFSSKSQGQEPNREWLDIAQRQADEYIAAGIQRLRMRG